MSTIQSIIGDYSKVISPMTPEKDGLLGKLETPEAGSGGYGPLSFDTVSGKADASGALLFKWLIGFGRTVVAQGGQSFSHFTELTAQYSEAKARISEAEALAVLKESAERWKNDAGFLFGDPNQFSQFKLKASGKVIDWFEFKSHKIKEGDYLRLVNRIEIISAYFGRLELSRLASFYRLLGFNTTSIESSLSEADKLVKEKSIKSEDLYDKKVFDALNEEGFWWFYRVPINCVLEY